jgi:GNAT superfamily N-acetyltransferase
VPDQSLDPEGQPVRPRPDGSDIRKAGDAESQRLGTALARAFNDDPVMSWVVPDDASRLRRLERGFGLFAGRLWLRHDECYTTDRGIGAAMWLPPGRWRVSIARQLALLPPVAAALGRHTLRLLRATRAIEARHPDDPHYYLAALGVEPEWQGRGFGAALMRPVLERCDRDRIPAYLEASTPRNRALYERHGFEVVEEMTVADSPPFWRMWREPGD